MKICVLGGFGVIGRAIVEQLLTQTDVAVVAADRHIQPVADVFGDHAARVHAVEVDVDRPASLAAALADCR
ncbi:NAD(P)H-binding protein, partial [Myxococcota bacterium]|nr:NAD(P)H-binding protein [Myxococcota bacterium]